MALEIYMVGVVVSDMGRAVEFYRRLGVAVPEGAEERDHVEVAMSGMTFFLNAKGFHQRVDPAWSPGSGGYRIILEFALYSRDAVDSTYAKMISHGYESHRAPYDPLPILHAAMINDPDGNTILLSADDRLTPLSSTNPR
jgi:predicted lactoylglutathione lyase